MHHTLDYQKHHPQATTKQKIKHMKPTTKTIYEYVLSSIPRNEARLTYSLDKYRSA